MSSFQSQSRAYFLAFRSADRAVTDVPHYNPTSARSGTSETGWRHVRMSSWASYQISREVPRYLIIGPAWWMLSRVWDMQVIRDLVRQLEIAKGLLLTESDNISISMWRITGFWTLAGSYCLSMRLSHSTTWRWRVLAWYGATDVRSSSRYPNISAGCDLNFVLMTLHKRAS